MLRATANHIVGPSRRGGSAVQNSAAGTTSADNPRRRQLVFAGCYTEATPFLFGSAGHGILSFELTDATTGSLRPLNGGLPTPAGTNPTYLTLSADGSRLYCANESEPAEVRSFMVDHYSDDAPLVPLNTMSTGGTDAKGACWVTTDPGGTSLLAANYTSGSVACLPLEPGTGRLLPASDVQNQRTLGLPCGPNKNRQEGPHAHAAVFSPTSPTDVYVPDLGLDMILHYKYNSDHGTLSISLDTSLKADGAATGPRHFCVHPSGKYGYLINEMASMVTPLAIDPTTGGLSICGSSVSTLPHDWEAATTAMRVGSTFTERGRKISHAAHIAMHPSGRWCYGSNRTCANRALSPVLFSLALPL
jgi:6-phosphogluconolactonase